MARSNAPMPSLAGLLFLICIFILAVYLISCGNGGNNNSPTPVTPSVKTIDVINDSPAVVVGKLSFDPALIADKIPVWQAQLNEISAAWGKNFKCSVQDNKDGNYKMYFTTANNPDCGPACHGVDDNNTPTGWVNPSQGIASGNDPLLEAGHEIDEMCVDPDITHTSNGILVEIVDPVVCWTYCEGAPVIPGMLECGENGSVNNGNIVPDFVFPSYYDSKGLPPYDFMHLLTKPRSHC